MRAVEDPLRAGARRRPDAPAVVDVRTTLTYGELDRRGDEVAARLGGLADGSGRCLALLLSRTVAAVSFLHAGPRAGLAVAPLSPRLTLPELSDAVEALDPVALVCDADTRTAAEEAAGGRRVVTTGAVDALEPTDPPLSPLAPDDDRYLVWTSGTAGHPRGVRLTGGALAAVIVASRNRLGLHPDDRWLASLSPAHVGGLVLVVRAAALGSALVVRRSFEAAELWRLAEAGRVTHASLVPVMLRRLLEHGGGRPAPAGLRCLLVGGGRAPEELVRTAVDLGYPVALTYGMTETSSQVTTAPPERVAHKPGAVGPPLDGVELRIADDGEIRVRGPTLAAGYVGGEPLNLDGEGWLRTGDLGRLDADGDLRVTGRRADRIVSGGVTVDAREVEGALRSISTVADAAVVGVSDPEWGERVGALVVLEGPGGAGEEEAADRGAAAAIEERLLAAVRPLLSGPKRPRLLRVVETLPRTRTGKVDRGRVRELLSAG